MILFLFIIGAACGSFSLVLAWRMHDKKNWVNDRSRCDHCGHILQTIDLIPILSWLLLRGKCRYCHKPLPKALIVAELLLGTVFATSYLVWNYDNGVYSYLTLVIWLLSAIILSALFWYDVRWYTLPTKLIIPLAVLSAVYVALKAPIDGISITNDVVYPILSAALLSGLFAGLYFVSSGKWIGFGDVRLAVPLGLFLGSPLNAWLMLFIASIIGIIIALPAMMKHKKKLSSKIPFGPMLISATWVVVLVGQNIIDWYINVTGL